MPAARSKLAVAALTCALTGTALAACSGGGSKSSASKAQGSTPAKSGAKSGSGAGSTTTVARPLTLQVSSGPALPVALSREVALADGDRVVLLGGLGSAGTSTAGVFRIDPVTGSSVKLGGLAKATHDSAGAVIDNAFVVFGGGEQQTIDTVQAITPGAPAKVIGHLPQPRSDLVTAAIEGHVYVLGGFDGTHTIADVLDTTDGVHFSVLTRLPTPVRYGAVAVTGHHIWLFGGEAGSTDTDQIQEVDVDARTARVVGHLPERLAHATALVIGGRVVLAGGRLSGKPTNRTWTIDPERDPTTVADGPTLPQALLDAASAVIGDTGYLFGGEAPKPLTSTLVLRMVPASK